MSSFIINPFLVAPSVAFESMSWNPSDKAAGINLSANNLEANHATGTTEWVRGTKGMASGKYCWCIKNDGGPATGTFWRTGIANSTFNLDSDTLGAGTTGVAISSAGTVSYNAGTLASYTAYNNYDYVMVAFDASAGDIWFGRNGTWNGDPGAGTGAVKSDVAADTWYPCWGTSNVGPQSKVTLIPYPYTPPSGFTMLGPASNVDLKHYETAHYMLMESSNGAWNGYNLRQVITAAQLPDITGTKIKVRLKGGSGENAQVAAAYIGHAAGAGDAYDFDGTQVQLTFSGSNAFTINAGAVTESDEITYAFDGSKALIIAFHFNNASHDTIGSQIVSGFTHYYKLAANETGTSDVSTYTTGSNIIRFVQEVLVYVDD